MEITTESNEIETYFTDEETFVFVGLEPGVMHTITIQSFDINNNTNGIKSSPLEVQTGRPLENKNLNCFTLIFYSSKGARDTRRQKLIIK